ncbi:TPA: cupin domain-containing protein [Streptococcus pneumoniae]|nr:cupin domain-containing protein [Streptococcus pneumoniae]HEW2226056.1 cupin domain-containing protein [Streptococcus pneumoniae]
MNKSYFNPLAPTDKEDLIRILELAPHVEGGYFRQTKKASDTINLAGKGRALYTSIYFLLRRNESFTFSPIDSR